MNPESRPRLHALLGDPVEHSLSPTMFNAAYKQQGLNREYIVLTVPPAQLATAVESVIAKGFDGFNVTMPLKERILPFIDRLEGDTKETGAVNTVTVEGSKLVGYNTDGEGAILALQAAGFDPSPHSVLILGAGGAARSIVSVLSKRGSDVLVINRTLERARQLALDSGRKDGKVSYGNATSTGLKEALGRVDLVVNATPLTMAKFLGTYGVPASAIPGEVVLFDLDYRNYMYSQAGKVHARTVSPFELLLQQALLSYRVWLDSPPPVNVMRRALVNQIGYDWREPLS